MSTDKLEEFQEIAKQAFTTNWEEGTGSVKKEGVRKKREE